jgi:hypothetical protein
VSDDKLSLDDLFADFNSRKKKASLDTAAKKRLESELRRASIDCLEFTVAPVCERMMYMVRQQDHLCRSVAKLRGATQPVVDFEFCPRSERARRRTDNQYSLIRFMADRRIAGALETMVEIIARDTRVPMSEAPIHVVGVDVDTVDEAWVEQQILVFIREVLARH